MVFNGIKKNIFITAFIAVFVVVFLLNLVVKTKNEVNLHVSDDIEKSSGIIAENADKIFNDTEENLRAVIQSYYTYIRENGKISLTNYIDAFRVRVSYDGTQTGLNGDNAYTQIEDSVLYVCLPVYDGKQSLGVLKKAVSFDEKLGAVIAQEDENYFIADKDGNIVWQGKDDEFADEEKTVVSELIGEDMLSDLNRREVNGKEYFVSAAQCRTSGLYVYSIKNVSSASADIYKLIYELQIHLIVITAVFLAALFIIWRAALSEIRKKQKRLERITNNVANGIVRINARNGNIIYANREYYDIFGLSPKEYVKKYGKTIPVLSSDNAQFDIESLNNGQYLFEKADGELIWLEFFTEKCGVEKIAEVLVIDSTQKHNDRKAFEETMQKTNMLTESVNGGVIAIERDEGGKLSFLYGNPELYKITRLDEESLKKKIERGITSLIYEDDIKYYEEAEQIMETTGKLEAEFRIVRGDGSLLWVHFNSKIFERENSVVIFCIIIDINNFKADAEKLESVANNVPGGVMQATFDDGFHIIYATDGYYELTGYSKEEYDEQIEKDYTRLFFDNGYDDFIGQINKGLADKNRTINAMCHIKCKDGSEKWLSFAAEKIETLQEKSLYQCLVIDMTAERQSRQEVAYERERYKIIFELCDDIIFEYNIKTQLINISPRFAEIFGFNADGNSFDYIVGHINDEDKETALKFFNDLFSGETANGKAEFRFFNEETEKYIWAEFIAIRINDDKIVGKVSNIDDMKNKMTVLKDKSQRDALTKLYNKTCIEEIINDYMSGEGKDKRHALMMIDIDNFKAVNDNLGHVFGDLVLKEVAENIKNVFGESVIAGRIGGDEFAVFTKDVSDTEDIDRKANEICDIFRNQYTGENRKYKISASVGIALYPNDGKIFKQLYENADIAVYTAKLTGKDRFEYFSPEMAEVEIDRRRKSGIIESNMRERSIMYENIVTNVMELILETKDTQSTINMIFSIVGKHYGLDRLYILEKGFEGKKMTLSYEWCDSGLESIKGIIDGMSSDIIDGDKFNKDNVYIWDEKTELSEYAKMRNNAGVKSALEYMIKENDEVTAFICFEGGDKDEDVDFYNSTVMILKLLASCIIKIKTDERNKINQDIEETIIRNQNMYSYVINSDDFKIQYESRPDSDEYKTSSNIGKVCYEVLMGERKQCSFCPLKHLREGSDTMSTNKVYDKEQNKFFGITSRWIDFNNNPRSVLVCKNDITAYVKQMDYKDTLTGLASLSKFKVTSEMMFEGRALGKEYVFIYIDVDKFKYINDNYGYAKGDEILSILGMVSTKFFEPNGLIGENGIVCRATDDKFIMMFEYTGSKQLKDKVKRMFREFNEMQEVYFKNINLVLIAGIYITKETDYEINSAIDKANLARKSIKGSHRSKYAVYTDEMHKQILKVKQIESQMIRGIVDKEFVVYYQAKVDLKTRKIVGAEALVRWIKRDGTIVSPADFIDIFEKNGFIINLDFYVYEEVFSQMRKWQSENKELVSISINISRLHISNPDFIDKLYNLVKKYEVPIKYIELELTESIFLEDMKKLVDFIERLKALGFKISIDDFGSAYSSLNMLKDIPVDVIKLDKEFFYQDNDNSRDRTIITHVINMVHDLDMTILCEGVETQEQVEFLTNAGCNLAQGYFFSKPVPADKFEDMLYGGE